VLSKYVCDSVAHGAGTDDGNVLHERLVECGIKDSS
jgi:hypothetical protein